MFISKLIDRRIARFQRNIVQTHFEEIDKMYYRMREWRHDYRSHIQTMKACLASGDLDSLSEYLDMLESDLASVDMTVKTGNKKADAILNSKITLAKSKGITVKVDADIPMELTVSELDLCIIIGNLFDNAIDAVLPLSEEQRVIRVYMDMKGTQLYLCITNLTDGGKLPMINGRFPTTKGEGHGLGLVRIDSIINRIGGYIRRASEDGAFTTEVLIPQ